ncbi:MAG: hypothetical protein IKX97_04665, partial [Erysipelotrichaceae bacterium]|nr:hypothetical protein [Erysipelotrichaceae bacterium]
IVVFGKFFKTIFQSMYFAAWQFSHIITPPLIMTALEPTISRNLSASLLFATSRVLLSNGRASSIVIFILP